MRVEPAVQPMVNKLIDLIEGAPPPKFELVTENGVVGHCRFSCR
jgi:hypothetical protein